MNHEDPAIQQERALDCAGLMRMNASQIRQMGFKELAKEYEKQAKAAERWAMNVVKGKQK